MFSKLAKPSSLSTIHALSIGICGFLVILLLTRIIRALLSPLRAIPGPFAARFTRLWYLRNVWHGEFQKINRHLHDKYGPIVRIAPNEYSIDDPKAIKTIYGHGTKFVKAPWYYASAQPGNREAHDLFTDRDAKRHAANRRKVAALYSTTNLLKMEPGVSECTHLLTERFSEVARAGSVINMQHYLQCYAFDVIGLITVAKRFGFLDKAEDNIGMFHSIHQYLIYCANVGIYSEWHDMVFGLFSKVSDGGVGHMIRFTNAQIQERLAAAHDTSKGSSKDDFLARALQMHQDMPEKFSMVDVLVLCMTNIGAGSDTTSISLSAIVYNLIQSKNALNRLRTEIEEKAAKGEVSNPVTFAESQKMPYLQAVIKESLRMHPATGLPLARVVPEGGATISGTYFPQNTVVGINTWVAHANKDVFGPDADIFRPERWLENEERSLEMERYFLAFGHGSRTCIGKNISLLEMSKLIPQLVRTFDFTLARPGEDLETENVWFVKQNNFYCNVSVR